METRVSALDVFQRLCGLGVVELVRIYDNETDPAALKIVRLALSVKLERLEAATGCETGWESVWDPA